MSTLHQERLRQSRAYTAQQSYHRPQSPTQNDTDDTTGFAIFGLLVGMIPVVVCVVMYWVIRGLWALLC